MLRLFLALTLLFLNLEACKGGYDSCKKKIIDSNAIVNNTLKIPVTKNKRLIFIPQTKKFHNNKNIKVIKKDPFLSLYLIEEKKGFKYPFKININYALGYAAVNKKVAVEGQITKKQFGLNNFAIFNEKNPFPSLLTNSCCSLEGIFTSRGIIEKEYLENFIKSKNSEYSDIGIRVIQDKRIVVIRSIDPFMKNNPFKIGDIILKMDGKKINSARKLMMDILFSKVSTSHKLKVKRGSKNININVTSYKRYGGGFISDTFLEQKGMFFSDDLLLVKLSDAQEDYGLKLGDKLVQVNKVLVKNQQNVLDNISNYKELSQLLFERNGFQFFVQIN